MKTLTTKQIAKLFIIGLPLEDIYVTQPFGVNYVNFYQQFGLKGHNGIDFRARRGRECFAVFPGVITSAGEVSGYGIEIRIETDPFEIGDCKLKIEAIYGHLERTKVSKSDFVAQKQVIATTDNTGKYTTGDHLHFGIRVWYFANGIWKYEDNGFKGWVNPDQLFSDRGWNLLPVQRRYNRTDVWDPQNPKWRPWHAYISEIFVAQNLWKKMRRRPRNIEIQAATYGGWDWESVANPALFPIWAELKKDEYLAGMRPKLNLGLNSIRFTNN